MMIRGSYETLVGTEGVEVANSEKELTNEIATYYTLAPMTKRINASKQTIVDVLVSACETQTGSPVFRNVFFSKFCLVASLKFSESEKERRKVLCFDLDYLENSGYKGDPFTSADAELLVADLCAWLDKSMCGLSEIITFEEEPCVVMAGNFDDKAVSVHVYFPRLTRLSRKDDLFKSHQKELDELNGVLKKYSLSVDASIDTSGLKLPFMDKKLKDGTMRGRCATVVLVKNIELPSFRSFFETVHPYVTKADETFERTIEWLTQEMEEEIESGEEQRTRIDVDDYETVIERIRAAIPEYEGVEFRIKDGRIYIPQSTFCPLKTEATDCPVNHHGSIGKVHFVQCGSTKGFLRCFVCKGEIEISVNGLTKQERAVLDRWGSSYAKMADEVLRLPLVLSNNEVAPVKVMTRKAFFDAENMTGRTIGVDTGKKKLTYYQEHVWAIDQPVFPNYPLGLICDPSGFHDPRYFNTWMGFDRKVMLESEKLEEENLTIEQLSAIVPNWTRMIVSNICDNDDDTLSYYLDWHGHLFQRPSEKPRTALVLRGTPGCGKSMSADFMLKICGPEVGTSVQLQDFTGDFNSVLADKRFVVVEEAIKSDKKFDHGRHNVLKNLITERTVISRQKFKDARSISSFSCFNFISNDDNPVHVETGDRRFVFFKCDYRVYPNGSTEQQHFVAELAAERDNPRCLAAIYQLLMRRDLTEFDPTKFRENRGLWDGVYDGLDELNKYLYGLFLTGNMADDETIADEYVQKCVRVALTYNQFQFVTREQMMSDVFSRENYYYPKALLLYCARKSVPHLSDIALWKRLGELFGGAAVRTTFKHKQVEANGESAKVFVFPPLEVCQETFSRFVRGGKTADLRIFNEWRVV